MEQMDKRLPGAVVPVAAVLSSGHSHNANGVGKINIEARRPDGRFVALVEVLFASPTKEAYDRLKDSDVVETTEEIRQAKSDLWAIEHRMSYKQAAWLSNKLTQAIYDAISEGIPADDEL